MWRLVGLVCVIRAVGIAVVSTLSLWRGFGYGDKEDGWMIDAGCLIRYRTSYAGPARDVARRQALFPRGKRKLDSWEGAAKRTASSFEFTVYSFLGWPLILNWPGYDTRWNHDAPVIIIDHRIIVPLWTVALTFGTCALVVWRHPVIGIIRGLRRRRDGAEYCSGCGYNLTGNVSGRCPECGTAVKSAA